MTRKTLDFPNKRELGSSLALEFKVFIPSTRQYSKKISQTAFNSRMKDSINFFVSRFGGASVDIEQGYYQFEGKPIKEKVGVISVSTTQKIYNRYDEQIEQWLKGKKKSWGQDSMGFMYKGKLVMV